MDRLNELAQAFKEGRISRREFFSLAAKAGISAAFASSFLAACAPAATPTAPPEEGVPEKLLIGFTNLLKANEFCATVEEGCRKACEKEGWDFYALDNDLNADKALANADAMVTKRVDFVWSFQALESLGPIIYEKYDAAGIPCITIDAGMYKTVRFGADNWTAGKVSGAWLANYAKENWGGVVDGVVGSWVASWSVVVLGRIEGCIKAISEVFPEWNDTTIDRLDMTLDAEMGEAGFRAWLNAHPDAHHILMPCATDVDGLAALAALQALGRDKDAAICAQGCDPTAVAELKKPENAFKASVGYFPEKYGEGLVPLTKDMLAGKPVAPDNFIEHVVVTRENVEEYYPS